MPILRNATSSNGATRYYDDNRGRCRATPKPDAQCPMCRQKHTVGKIMGCRTGRYYCRECCIEFNTRTGNVIRPTADGGAYSVRVGGGVGYDKAK